MGGKETSEASVEVDQQAKKKRPRIPNHIKAMMRDLVNFPLVRSLSFSLYLSHTLSLSPLTLISLRPCFMTSSPFPPSLPLFSPIHFLTHQEKSHPSSAHSNPSRRAPRPLLHSSHCEEQ